MGEDPIAFTAEVEKISQQQAQMNAIAALPPEQQQQIMMLQQMMAQADQQGQPQQGQNPLQEAVQQENAADVPPMAMFGRELKKAQDGKETKKTLEIKLVQDLLKYIMIILEDNEQHYKKQKVKKLGMIIYQVYILRVIDL